MSEHEEDNRDRREHREYLRRQDDPEWRRACDELAQLKRELADARAELTREQDAHAINLLALEATIGRVSALPEKWRADAKPELIGALSSMHQAVNCAAELERALNGGECHDGEG